MSYFRPETVCLFSHPAVERLGREVDPDVNPLETCFHARLQLAAQSREVLLTVLHAAMNIQNHRLPYVLSRVLRIHTCKWPGGPKVQKPKDARIPVTSKYWLNFLSEKRIMQSTDRANSYASFLAGNGRSRGLSPLAPVSVINPHILHDLEFPATIIL